jgi:hypothetical protein
MKTVARATGALRRSEGRGHRLQASPKGAAAPSPGRPGFGPDATDQEGPSRSPETGEMDSQGHAPMLRQRETAEAAAGDTPRCFGTGKRPWWTAGDTPRCFGTGKRPWWTVEDTPRCFGTGKRPRRAVEDTPRCFGTGKRPRRAVSLTRQNGGCARWGARASARTSSREQLPGPA